MKSESGVKKRKVSDAKNKARNARSKMPLIVGGIIILSIAIGFGAGMIFFPKNEEPNEETEVAKEEKVAEEKVETTNSEWGDAYLKYFAGRDDLKEAISPVVSAVDFAGDEVPELILNYSTSVSNKTQVLYIDSEKKVQASDGYNNARLVLLFPVEETGEGDESKPNLNPAPTWYLFNGSDTEYGRYAKIDDIITGRTNPVFINATTDQHVMELHEQYIEITPQIETFSLNMKKIAASLKEVVQSGEFSPINENISKSVSSEISDRFEVKKHEEEEKRAEEERQKAEAEAQKISTGIKVGDYTVAYGSYVAKIDGGDSIKIILKSDDTYAMENTSTGSISAGSIQVDGTKIKLGTGADAVFTVVGDNKFTNKDKVVFSK